MPQEFDALTFQIDHVIAVKHHGKTDFENLALACFACNNHKGPNLSGFDARTKRVVRLYHPRSDRWDDHFEWRGPVLHGRSDVGRVTVDVLAINLPHRVQLRRALGAEGVFPSVVDDRDEHE